MAQLQKGTTYLTGDQVTAANLNALVDSGLLIAGAITDQTAKTVPLAADTILLHSAADTALRKTTMTQLFATPQPLGATTPSSVAATTGTFSSTLGVTGVATLGNGAILGTPASGTVTNLTGTASININGTVGATTPSTVAATTGVFSSYVVGAGTNPGGLGGSKWIYDWFSGNHRQFSMGADASTNGAWTWYSQRSDGSNSVIPMTLTSTGLNSTVIGATTPAAGSFTTLSATGAITQTQLAPTISISSNATGKAQGYFNTNSGANGLSIGSEGSAGNALAAGAAAYGGVVTTVTNHPVYIGVNGTVVGTFTSTGLNSTAIGATTPAAGSFTTLGATGLTTLSNGQALSTAIQQWNVFSGVTAQLRTGSDAHTDFGNTTNHTLHLMSNGTRIAAVSTTGLAVTGTLSASAQTTLAGAVQITTTSFPSTGAGLELSYNGNNGFVQSYSRTGSAYTPLYLIGNNIQIAPNGSNVGVFSSTGLAVTGALSCTGALSKGSGSFRIEHPLPSKSATHQLVHSFIEGPKCDLIYRGKVDLVNGKASVNIDTDSTMTEGTFEVLCANVQCFTSNESGWGAIRGKVTGNILTIEAQDAASTDNVSWMVIGERKDKHIMDTDWTDENGRPIVEPFKPVEPALEFK